jgi:hypothetical protein
MAVLADSMPPLVISTKELRTWGERWLAGVDPDTGKTKNPNAFDRRQSVHFASFIDLNFRKFQAGQTARFR